MKRRLAGGALLLAICLLWTQAALGQAQSSIWVQSVEHEVRFAQHIIFRLEARASE
ncbi:MAG: hypothetical protein GX605_05515, partial [Chloroflexi bacterium]|nr:hypothetical protein [Chloroflexota bacterium]